jgi:hypothetical protein
MFSQRQISPNESAAILVRKTRLAFKMSLVDNRAADARFGSKTPN